MMRPPCVVKRQIVFNEFEIEQGIEIYKTIYRLILFVAELGALPYETAFFKIADNP